MRALFVAAIVTAGLCVAPTIAGAQERLGDGAMGAIAGARAGNIPNSPHWRRLRMMMSVGRHAFRPRRYAHTGGPAPITQWSRWIFVPVLSQGPELIAHHKN